MGVQFNKYLTGPHLYCCKYCETHLAFEHDIESKVSIVPFSLFSVRSGTNPQETRECGT